MRKTKTAHTRFSSATTFEDLQRERALVSAGRRKPARSNSSVFAPADGGPSLDPALLFSSAVCSQP